MAEHIFRFLAGVILLAVYCQAQNDAAAVNSTTVSPPTGTPTPPTRPPLTPSLPPVTVESTTIPTTSSPPICRTRTNCTSASPRSCGRNRRGLCRNFNNICQLERINCQLPGTANDWRATPRQQCRNIRPGRTARCAGAPVRCPRRPLRCPRFQGQRLCIRSRNRRLCRVVANSCELRNLNCNSRPRQNWLPVRNNFCRNMCLDGRATRCTL